MLQELVDSGDLPELPDGFPTVTYDDSDPDDPKLVITDERDLSIPIGTWTLRLVPHDDATDGSRLEIHLEPGADGGLTGLHVELARFELIADPDHLVAADLHTEPYTHLTPTETPNGDRAPVRLLGPGVTLRMSGDGLADVDVEVTGAEGGSDDAFPSVRFEPPHFLIGDGFIGVVCDEVLLDLSTSDNPQVVDTAVTTDGTWRGLHLKKLGVFLNSEGATDTWSGMASMQDFSIGFDAVDLTGTFSAELVHHVVPSPQVVVQIWARDSDGSDVLVSDSSGAQLDAPETDELDYRLVRLVARPSWDDPDGVRAAGARVSWTVPDGVTVEEPLHLTDLDLGWVQVPPGVFSFSVEVRDPPIDTISETRVVTVATPTTAGTTGLAAILDAGLIDPDVPATQLPTHRLHVSIPVASPGREVRIVGRVRGGSGTAQAALDVPAGFTITSGPPTTSISRPTGENAYEPAVWIVTAPTSLPGTVDGAFELVVTDGDGTTVRRRLRFTLVPAPDPFAPDVRLTPYTDWRADAGPGIARIELLNGLAFRDIRWELEHGPVTDALFSDVAGDGLFGLGVAADTGLPIGQSAALSLSAGTIRPHLHTTGQLWRLTGTVGSDAAPVTPPPVVIGEPADSSRLAGEEVALLADAPSVQVHDPLGVLFAYDSAGVQIATSESGPEAPELQRSHAQIMTLQAQGLAVLLEALHRYGDRIQEVGVYGAASAEGPLAYNHHLGQQRARAVGDVLAAFVAGSASSTLLGALDAVGYVPPTDLQARIAHLDGRIVTGSVGETGADSTPGAIDPDDRRVFAVLRLATVTPATVTHRTYFVTLPGAPPPAIAPAVPRRELADHPFRHAIFRQARVEVELLRNQLVRLQIRLTVDLEWFKENDLPDTTELNPHDGVTTIFFEYVEDPSEDGSRYGWKAAALADPRDVDGIAVISDPTAADLVGGPAIVVPALTALAGGKVGLSAFLAASAVGALLTGSGAADIDRIVWTGFNGRLAHGRGGATELRFGIDYTVHYDLDVDLSDMGLPLRLQTSEPITVTFRNLGVSLRDGQHVEFDYDPMDGFSLEVDDPGVFQLGEGIGRLLAVNSFRSGAGSPLWIELELAIGLETGIFRIDALRLRLSVDAAKLFDRDASGNLRLGAGDLEFADFDLSISKLGVSATVPGVLAGSGQASIGEAVLDPSGITGTQVSGDIDLALLPMSLRLYAGMKLFHSDELTAVYAALGAEFSPGIPLGNTGVGLYGVEGLVGVNMTRSEPDPAKVLDWYQQAPRGVTHSDKWDPEPGSWAFGVGAVLGTAVDTGFTWSTKGGLVVQGPGPQILLSTYSRFVSPKPGLLPVAAEAGLATVILLDFEHGLLLAALEFELVAEPLLTVEVPAEIFFNLRAAKDWHLRLGTWTPEHKRIQARIFGMFDAWAYVQIEGDGFDGPGISLSGLSVAHGAGTSLVMGSRAARVYAEGSLAYHLGAQLRPFYVEGNLTAEGELHLGPVSLGVSFSIEAKAPTPFVLRGEACAKVKIWFVTIEGCVGFSIGSGSATTPDPEHPLRDLVAVDRMTSAAIEPDPQTPSVEPRVPLDAALHLTFDQVVRDRWEGPAALDLGAAPVWRNQVSTDLYYEYDLTELRLVDDDGATHGPVQSAWAQPSLEDAAPPETDGPRALRLLDWKPNAHTRALDFEAGYGRTVDRLVQRLCEPVADPVRGCATFDGQPFGPGSHWRLDDGTLSPVTAVCGFGEVVGGAALQQPGGPVAASVVEHPSVEHDLRQAKRKALRLPSSPTSRRGFDLEQVFASLAKRDDDVVAEDEEKLTPEERKLRDHEREQTAERREALAALSPWAARLVDVGSAAPVVLPALLLVRLPDVVEAEAVLLVRREVIGGGALFLTDDVTPIGGMLAFDAAPTVLGSHGREAFIGHRAIALRLEPSPRARIPARAAWLAIVAPDSSHLDGTSEPTERGVKPRNPSDLDVHAYLGQVCGTTFGAWDRARQARQARATAQETLTDLSGPVAGTSASSTAPLLAPATRYRVTGTLAWRRYRSADGDAADGTGTLPIDHTFTTVADAPTDIRRHVHDLDPATPDQPHYGAEPVTIRFGEDVIDRLFAAFGRQLVARLKPDVGGRALNQPLRDGSSREFLPLDSYARTMAAAVDASDCLGLHGDRLFPALVYRTSLPLERNTGYTLSLLPRPLTDPSRPADAPEYLSVEDAWDEDLQRDFDAGTAVLRAELRSSRWLSFAEHVAAFRDEPVLDVIGGDPTALADVVAELGGGARGDAAIDALDLALFGGPLPVPSRCQVVRLWTIAGPAPGPFAPPPFAFAGLLLDGPEPLLRRRPDGTASVEVEVRTDAGALLEAAVITGTAGARVALMGTPPPDATDLRVLLTYHRDPADVTTSPRVEELVVVVPSAPGA